MKVYHLAAALALAIHTPVWAETLHQINHSPIAKVIAYQGQGIVTREVKINLPQAGDYQLRITDIPLGIVGDSLNVSGQGSASVIMHNVQLMPLPPGTESDLVKVLNVQIAEVQAKLARLENIAALNERSQEWLDAYWERVENQESRTTPETWQKTLDFLSQNQARILESVTKTKLEQEKLETLNDKLNVKLKELQANEELKTQAAAVYFSAKTAGEIKFQLSYLIPGIRWTPSYNARLDEKAGQISLTYFGDLLQQTGESWKEVQLSLSTSAPQINAAVTVLEPWILTDRMPMGDGLGAMLGSADEKSAADDASTVHELETTTRTTTGGANFAESEVQTQGLSVLFAIPQRVSIESAPQPRRVAIATRTFKYDPEYHVVPKVSSRVYLKARFRNTDNLPLLTGQIRNYVDQDYTGTSQLSMVRPNEEASLNFGVDENIRVIRKQGMEKTTLEGLMRDTRRRVMSYEVEVSNFKNQAVKVALWDHLPLARNEAIRVDVLQLQPPPSEKTKDNLLKWVLELKPQESKKISVSYAVEHPVTLEVYSNFNNDQLSPMKRQRPMQQYEKF